MNWWWLSSSKMTVAVCTVGEDRIYRTPPIVAKFKGQPLANLINWMTKQGGFQYEQLTEATALMEILHDDAPRV